MRIVTTVAKVNEDLCTGCGICASVCPVLAIEMVDRKPQRSYERCMGCGLCESRCPVSAISMVPAKEKRVVKVNLEGLDQAKIVEICLKAKFHPKQVICYCTRTRAEEMAAAILKGAKSPEEISLMTGARTGCKVECIQPMLRLLDAAGIKPQRPKGWQWYGKTSTLWEISDEVKRKHAKRGYYFDEDVLLMEKILEKGKI